MKGWILDVYPDHRTNEMVVWIKAKNGKTTRLADTFAPAFYVSANKYFTSKLIEELTRLKTVDAIFYDTEKDLIDGIKPENLLKIECSNFSSMTRLAEKINERGEFSRYKLYNVDISLPLQYLFEKGISPMVLLSAGKGSDFIRYDLLDDPNDLVYEAPELKEVSFDIEVKKQDKIAKVDDPLGSITLKADGESLVFEGDEGDILVDLSKTVQRIDPDVIFTEGGDSFVFPYLFHRIAANELEKEFQLGRELSYYANKKEGKSYFTYGRVVYKPPSYVLKGRIHIDRGSFMFSESGLHGLIDLSRISGIPIQMLSRMSPGNAITTMQLRYAYDNDILVPWKRQNPEYFKTGYDLIYSDRGGYIFDPRVGIFDNVTELDFSSMYPNIMVKFNISPETVLCKCCKGSSLRVPVLDYNICEKRIGLVPRVLRPIIERRFAYKKLMKNASKEDREIYDQRQAILKWILITSFGYQGYRNARFGRIESHESICAFGRELLLKAKEIAEFFGFEVLHGLVDSLWVRKEASVEELEKLCEMISADIGIDLNLEGRYKWIVFLPNKSNGVGALNRYYGLFENGELKVRGVEMRMRNTPQIIVNYQKDVLGELAKANNVDEVYASLPRAFEILRRYVTDLKDGKVNLRDLILTVGISKYIHEYRQNNFSLAALKQLYQEGIELTPGQFINYIVTNHKARRHIDKVKIAEAIDDEDGYDKEFYTKHLLQASESLFSSFGFTMDRLSRVLVRHEQSTIPRFAIECGDA